MKYWFVNHSIQAYLDHAEHIGKEKRLAGKINSVKRGDRIVYYAVGDSVVVGTFTVGKREEWPDDPYWHGPHVCMRITRRVLARKPYYLPMADLLSGTKRDLRLFPHRKFQPIKLRGRTAIEIARSDFQAIERVLREYKAPVQKLFRGPGNDENLGSPIDLEVLNYAPTSEQGVVALFVHFMKRLGTHQFEKIEFIRQGFPDACAIEKQGAHYSRKYIEFEFNARAFHQHIKDERHRHLRCDYVVCWIDDFPTCPVEVIELRKELQQLQRKG